MLPKIFIFHSFSINQFVTLAPKNYALIIGYGMSINNVILVNDKYFLDGYPHCLAQHADSKNRLKKGPAELVACGG